MIHHYVTQNHVKYFEIQTCVFVYNHITTLYFNVKLNKKKENCYVPNIEELVIPLQGQGRSILDQTDAAKFICTRFGARFAGHVVPHVPRMFHVSTETFLQSKLVYNTAINYIGVDLKTT